MGCCACEIACKMENELPAGIRYIVMNQKEDQRAEKERLVFEFSICYHCESPKCMEVCPNDAIIKRKDGIVLVDDEKCTGCRLCKLACPFNIPQFHQDKKMKKCNLCYYRLDQGLQPACVLACPANAIEVK